MFPSPLARLDATALGEAWRAAKPFPHLVIDDFVPPDTLNALRKALSEEPHYRNQSELYDYMASADVPQHATLKAFAAALAAPESLAVLQGVTGKKLTRVDMRSYVYMAGMYSVPHTDRGRERGVAFAFYLVGGDAITGGELDLFACTLDDTGEVVATEPAVAVQALHNRIAIFDVSNVSLHQVREVLSGARCSLAGWFFP